MKKLLFVILIVLISFSVFAEGEMDEEDKGAKPKLGHTALEGMENVEKIKKQKVDFILEWDEAIMWKTPLEEYYVKHAEKREADGKKPLLTKEGFEKEFYKNFDKALKKQKKYLNKVDSVEDVKTKYYFIVKIMRFFPIPTQFSILVFRTYCYEKDNPDTPFFIVRSVVTYDDKGMAPGRIGNKGMGLSGMVLVNRLGWLIKLANIKSPD